MPKITINGKEVEVKDGSTIIEAYKEHGESIAHYCWHPGLTVAGVCRLCMVEVEGNPRLQIACNTKVADGMVVNNDSEKVREAVKWGLDFHLINHPLDCPICDQAGECGLQEQYMEFGKYTPEMAEKKVKKKKVVDLGPTVVLDSERCILCSRCVRFTSEVSKTNELGIFNRGDRSEIGTFEGKPLNNNYSLNTVDICPVGALTSKDFRFRQRVWYLENSETICTGCSTGCNVKVYHNEEGAFRVKPVFNEQVNGHWMCDEGRFIYKHVNKDQRLLKAKKGSAGNWQEMYGGGAAKNAGEQLRADASTSTDSVALVLTGQYSSEEYESILSFFAGDLKTKNVYHWVNNKESFDDFDGILNRGDKNPNTKGLLDALAKYKLEASFSDLESKLQSGQIKTLVVAGPENLSTFNDVAEKVKAFGQAANVIWLTCNPVSDLDGISANVWQIPMRTYLEKEGTYVNYKGVEQKVSKVANFVRGALSLSEVTDLLSGKELTLDGFNPYVQKVKKNHFTALRGEL